MTGYKAAARYAAALSVLFCLTVSGCKRPARPPVAPTPAYIRINGLHSLHPAWADVQQIDALIAYARRMTPSTTAPSTQLTQVTMPPPLPTQEAPAPVRRPEKNELRQPALGRVARLRELYEALGARVLDRERKEVAKKLKADVAAHRAELVSNPAPVDLTGQRVVDAELRRLMLLEIAYESQVRVLLDPARTEAQKKLVDVRSKIKAAQARLKIAPDTFEQRVAAEVESFRKRKEAEYDQQLATRAAELAGETRRILDDYLRRIDTRLDAVEAIPPVAIPPRAPLFGGALPGPTQVAAALRAPAPQPVTADPTKALSNQRARLVAFITDDVKRRVQRLAILRNWQVSYTPAARTVDMTGQAAAFLREEFARKAEQ